MRRLWRQPEACCIMDSIGMEFTGIIIGSRYEPVKGSRIPRNLLAAIFGSHSNGK